MKTALCRLSVTLQDAEREEDRHGCDGKEAKPLAEGRCTESDAGKKKKTVTDPSMIRMSAGVLPTRSADERRDLIHYFPPLREVLPRLLLPNAPA
jgi:hypothetical protein